MGASTPPTSPPGRRTCLQPAVVCCRRPALRCFLFRGGQHCLTWAVCPAPSASPFLAWTEHTQASSRGKRPSSPLQLPWPTRLPPCIFPEWWTVQADSRGHVCSMMPSSIYSPETSSTRVAPETLAPWLASPTSRRPGGSANPPPFCGSQIGVTVYTQ